MKKNLIILFLFLTACTSPEEKQSLEKLETIYGGKVLLTKGKSSEDISKFYYEIEVNESPIVNDSKNRLDIIAGNCAVKHFETLTQEDIENHLTTSVVLTRNNKAFEFIYKKDILNEFLASKKVALNFLSLVKNNKLEEAYGLLNVDLKEKYSFQIFSTQFVNVLNTIGGINIISFQGVTSEETTDNKKIIFIESVVAGTNDKSIIDFFIDPNSESPILEIKN
jgi:hypothetical protein